MDLNKLNIIVKDMVKTCPHCSINKPVSEFLRSDGFSVRATCRACRATKERISLKLRVFNAYGNICNCCGLSDTRFLSLDHVNNDGNIDRITEKTHQTYQRAARENFPPKYQLLCYNCNMAKSIYGRCPHKIDMESGSS